MDGTRHAIERADLGEHRVLADTNIATLYALDDLVYKVRKPLAFAFVDQRSPEARHALCQRELELNRRFCRDVYLRIDDIVDGGAVVDWAVVMKRLPSDRALSRLVITGARVDDCVRAVARLMARAHGEAPRSDAITRAGSNAAVNELWRLSVDEMRVLVPTIVDGAVLREVGERSHSYLAGRGPLFEQRAACGHIVDGHGDLLADDIYCLGDGPRVLDCLEFDDRFRFGDVLLDIAFLVMDLERLGRPDLAERLVRDYIELTNEHHPRSLVDHFVAYRALVRAKVLAYRAASGIAGAADDSSRLLALAANHLVLGQVRLIVIGGLPATGKTTLAEALSGQRGWAVVSTDAVRRELAGVPQRDQGFGEGTHSNEITDETYGEVLRRAAVAIGLGESVIVDGSFADARWRDRARAVAAAGHATLTELRCVAPSYVADDRMTQRRSLSDATPAIAAAMARRFAPWPTATEIDSSASIEHATTIALATVR